mgnify:CR=1 FL=1
MKQTGLWSFFDFLITSDSVEFSKPYPHGLQKIARQFQCSPDEIIVVGDHDIDMQAAESVGAVGLRACWHSYQSVIKCNFKEEVTFQSVSNLRSWIDIRTEG